MLITKPVFARVNLYQSIVPKTNFLEFFSLVFNAIRLNFHFLFFLLLLLLFLNVFNHIREYIERISLYTGFEFLKKKK